MPPSTTRRREQVNFAIATGDRFAERLRAAEKATGQSRSQIARRVVEEFLDLWLAAQLRQRGIADEARAAALSRILAPTEPEIGATAEPTPGSAEEFQRYLRAAGRLLDASPDSVEFGLAMAELTPGVAEAGGGAAHVLHRLERLTAGA